MTLRVYQNLRRHDWSMLDPRTGLVVGHRTALVLLNVTFIVSERVRLLDLTPSMIPDVLRLRLEDEPTATQDTGGPPWTLTRETRSTA